MSLLFDSCAVIEAVRRGVVEILFDQYIQPLTSYEVLNAVWKEHRLLGRLSREEAERLASYLLKLLGYMRVLAVRGLEKEFFRVAVELGVTVYDASYIVLARHYGLTLVTEDRRLARAARGVVEVASVGDVTGRRA
ncbi:MAG: type II toxin-antitoxin system VapC family toxin [Crenarchaeota archaeon]|nr:type II toxin-antitoxin system VapC family toxin [Thermoproteota archaeon]